MARNVFCSSVFTHRSVSRSVRDSAVEALRLPREERVPLVLYEAAVISFVIRHVGLAVDIQEHLTEHDVVCVGDGLGQEIVSFFLSPRKAEKRNSTAAPILPSPSGTCSDFRCRESRRV